MTTIFVILVVLWGELPPAYHEFPNTKMCIATRDAILANQKRGVKAFCVDVDGNVISEMMK